MKFTYEQLQEVVLENHNGQNITRKEIFSLASDAYKGISSHKDYSADERREGINNLLTELATNYRKNSWLIFEVMEETMGQELPTRILNSIGRFAEVKPFADGETIKFIIKNGKIKAYTVALGSQTRRQRIDNRTVTIEVSTIQAKIYESIKRIRSGAVDFVELMDMAMDAVEDEIYKNIFNAMKDSYGSMPTANVHTGSTLVESEFDKVVNVIKAYGRPVIYGTPLALASLPVDNSDASKNDVREKGYIGKYKGCNVVEVQNSFEDEENTTSVFDDSYIFIIPEGKEKLVKVGLEGKPYIVNKTGEDATENFLFQQDAGVAVLNTNHFGIYINQGI